MEIVEDDPKNLFRSKAEFLKEKERKRAIRLQVKALETDLLTKKAVLEKNEAGEVLDILEKDLKEAIARVSEAEQQGDVKVIKELRIKVRTIKAQITRAKKQ